MALSTRRCAEYAIRPPIVQVVVMSAVMLAATVHDPAAQRRISPVTDAMLEAPPPEDWLMWRRTLDSRGYSPLDQINRSNVRNLALVWSRGLTAGIQEGTPLVHDGVMFMPNPLDIVHAIDAATGDLLWEYRRQLPADIGKAVPFPAINRNLAIYGSTIIDTSADDFVYALDAATGKLVWETRILDYQKNAAQQTSGPIVARGRVVSGRGCEPKGGPEACVVTAHDARTGRELWRTRTIPMPGEPGDDTWGGVPFDNRWHVGTWMVPSYDPELDLIYVGTSVTSPAPKFALGGNGQKHLYHNSTLALRADTGRIAWYYQHAIDHWDLDHPFERLLVDTAVAPNGDVPWINPRLRHGERRRVMTGIPGKTGIVYTLDRQTGEFLWAKPTIEQNVIADIDGGTGAVTVNPEMIFTAVGQSRVVCPGLNGGKNWPAGAYSPLTNTMYFPLQNTCMAMTSQIDRPTLTSLYGFSSRNQIAAGSGDRVGAVHAISVETGKTMWKYEQRAATTSLVATGGRLLFGGDANGRFRAFDQETGKVLWEVNLGSAVTGYPIAYASGGRQYIAVSTGGSLATGGLNGLTPELRPGASNTLFVFALPAN